MSNDKTPKGKIPNDKRSNDIMPNATIGSTAIVPKWIKLVHTLSLLKKGTFFRKGKRSCSQTGRIAHRRKQCCTFIKGREAGGAARPLFPHPYHLLIGAPMTVENPGWRWGRTHPPPGEKIVVDEYTVFRQNSFLEYQKSPGASGGFNRKHQGTLFLGPLRPQTWIRHWTESLGYKDFKISNAAPIPNHRKWCNWKFQL